MYRYDRYQSMFHTGPAKLPYMVIHVVCKLTLMQKSKHNNVYITNILLLM